MFRDFSSGIIKRILISLSSNFFFGVHLDRTFREIYVKYSAGILKIILEKKNGKYFDKSADKLLEESLHHAGGIIGRIIKEETGKNSEEIPGGTFNIFFWGFP